MSEVYKYGIRFNGPPTELELELAAFLNDPTPENGGLGKAEHFWNICTILWGPKSSKHFVRHPWAERMVDAALRHPYLGLCGAASTGKTDFGAVWGIVNWLCSPKNTLVMMTSTSLKASQQRIWGSVKGYWQAVPGLPGKIVDSMGIIRTDDGSGIFNDKEGIALIACDKKDEKQATEKFIGGKNKRVFLIGDELPELTEGLITAAVSNLASNPFFQFIGIGNFKGIYDPFGVFVRPKRGYGSISPDDEEWETELGWCLRFDGMKSPNILGGKDIWPIYDSKTLAGHRKNLGADSAAFWRMCRSFPCPEGDEHVLYSEADFIKGDAHGPVLWMEPPIPVVAGDPAFTSDGDKFAYVTGLFGKSSTGLQTLCITGYQYIHESMELTKAGEPRDVQTARQFAQVCRDHKCAPENAGVDASGPGGLAYASILSAVWSSRFLPVKFGEKPSERLVSEDDSKRCDEAYVNRVTELWAIGRQFIRAGQIKGLPQAIAKELKSRFYETVKGVTMKMKVESKRDMKARVGFSPDLGDSALILVELCRERFGFTPGSMNGVPQLQNKNRSWIDRANKAHSVYDPEFAYSEPAHVAFT